MKPLLRKIFFWDAPAQGEFFALTLLFTLPWFLLVWGFHNGRIPVALWLWSMTGTLWDASAVTIPAVLALLCVLYALFLCWRGRRRDGWHFKLRKEDVFWYLSVTFLGGAGCVWYIIFASLRMETAFTFREHCLWDTDIARLLGIYGNAWGWFALLGHALSIASYLLLGKAIAIVHKTPLRKLFGKGVFALWGLVLASYLFCLAMAFRANADYKRSVEELAEYFGRPMTAAAVGELYFDGRTPDAAFWKNVANMLKKADESFSLRVNGIDAKPHAWPLIDSPDAIMDEGIYAQWQAYLLDTPLEALLEAPLPPAEREFRDDKYLCELPFDDGSRCMSLAAFELWRLRVAVETADVAVAKSAWQGLEAICDYLHTLPFGVGNVCWIRAESFRMKALERLVPWEKTETEWLEAQVLKLAEMEEVMAQVETWGVYGEAVLEINRFQVFLSMERDVVDYPLVKLPALRWFFPQIWWRLSGDAAEMMRCLRVSKYPVLPRSDEDPTLHNWVMGFFWNCLYEKWRERFSQLAARLRIMRGLIDAELHKRRTGSYPDALEGLPLDPFSEQPLKYRKGTCQVTRQVCILKPAKGDPDDEHKDEAELFGSQSEEEWQFEPREETVEAVQIWSVGPDGIDDGGLNKKAEYGSEQKSTDDIRFIIPIR